MVLITCLVLLIKVTTTMHIGHLIFWAVRRRWYCLTMAYELKDERKGKNRWSADFNLNFSHLRALLSKIITFFNVWLLNFYISRCKHVDNFFCHWVFWNFCLLLIQKSTSKGMTGYQYKMLELMITFIKCQLPILVK